LDWKIIESGSKGLENKRIRILSTSMEGERERVERNILRTSMVAKFLIEVKKV
jgi:hypothetical protein